MRTLLIALALLALAAPAHAQRWVTSWAASVQGPYPVGNPSAQPDLKSALPDDVARDQTFRLIIKPTLWSNRMRLRFSNAFGTKPATFDAVFLGLQWSGAALMPRSNRPVTFAGRKSVTIPPGGQAWSDAVTVPWVSNADAPELLGRKLAVSFHVAGDSGPITWHAKAMQTSYLTQQGAGALGEFEDESAFPNSTTSWYFLDALDAQAAPDTGLVVCLGDSITDGTNSTLNGDDRWPDILARRLHAAGITMAVADAGIGGNQVVGPAEYAPDKPFPGGPSALSRLERDVIGLSGVTHVIWLEGINDFSTNGNASVEAVRDGIRAGVKRLRERIKGVKIIAATLTPVAGTTSEAQQPAEVDQKRKAYNEFIRSAGNLFDGVIDFEKATIDPAKGGLRPEFVPNSTIGGPGDGLHPNRAGYIAMGEAVDLRLLRAARPRPRPAAPAKPEDSVE
ncbi:MAG TPA: GDSL-type esterase/lipase family protein [Acetobacteraceae bacterium]|jgi:lysophospholipase L1-like esterase|nr:GDSL-type esterase/lipase family protein [Acetobacteraceae bacterium]